MTEYRAYAVSNDGNFTGFEPLACAEDAEAISQAKQLLDDYHAIEVWNGARFVQRLSGEKSRKTIGYQIKDGCMVPNGE
jgi:hypothetical protein